MDAMGTGATAAWRRDGAGPVGMYKPRRPQASPLFRLVADQCRTLQMVLRRGASPPRTARGVPYVGEVADKFLACGVLDHGFARARARCDACAHEYLLAFSCRARYFCPSCVWIGLLAGMTIGSRFVPPGAGLEAGPLIQMSGTVGAITTVSNSVAAAMWPVRGDGLGDQCGAEFGNAQHHLSLIHI